jgi:hypothetical protein
MGSAVLGQSRIVNHVSLALLQSPKEPGCSARSSLLAFGRRLPMFSRSVLLKIVLVVSALATMASVASAAAASDQSTQISTGMIRTYLTPDLTLKSYFPELATAATGAKLHGTCRCSCGSAPCSSDADCGGVVGSCAAAPSCCAKQPEAQMAQASPEASRQTEPPVMDFKCK